ncbi:MAG: O-antigen ligase family protein, partial [Acidimicrobiales bacterium]
MSRPEPGQPQVRGFRGGALQVILGSAVGLMGGLAARDRTVALVLAAGVPFVLLTSLRTKLAVYLVVLPLVGWFKIHYPQTSVQGIPEIIGVTMLAQVGLEMLVRRGRLPSLKPYVLLAGVFALIVVIQSRNPIIARVGGGFGGARVYLAPMVLFLIGLYILRDREDVKLFLRIGVITAGIVGLYMLKQALFGFDHAEKVFWAARPNTFVISERKIFSTLIAPDVYGFVSAFFTLLCMSARSARVLPRLATLTAALSGVGVVASGERIAAAALLLSSLVFLGIQLTDPATRAAAFRIMTLGLAGLTLLGALVAVTPTRERFKTQEAGNPFEASIQKLALLKKGTADDDYSGRVKRVKRFSIYIRRHPWGTGPGVTTLLTEGTFTEQGHHKPDLPPYVINEPFIFQHD